MKRQKTEWGVRLVDHPLGDDMYIQAEVAKTRGTRVSFSGTIPGQPLRQTDIQVWITSVQALMDAARSEMKKISD
jgi:hypothetical protein